MAKRDTPACFCVQLELEDAALAEWAAAEGWEAGALGVEERTTPAGGTLLLIYSPSDRLEAVQRAVLAVIGARLSKVEPVVETDWSQAWKEGLEAIRVGERLVVRPSWIPVVLAPGQVEVVVDPGQAFGTGGHVSTRLALQWIEALANEGEGAGEPGRAGQGGFTPATRVLDVGCGTGVLALAALKLGAGRAVGFDLDPLAGEALREWAARNQLSHRLAGFVGPIEALAGARFDWVLANLLKRELLPIAGEIAALTRPGGYAVFSGLLASERSEVQARLEAVGLADARARSAVDANGDEWISLRMQRRAMERGG